MCGIAGFWGDGERGTLSRMLACLVHRGPDGEGTHVDEAQGLFLGQRRLAILDLPGGAQPMWNEDRTVCVVYNGEVYNHRTLRDELEALGHRFASDHADTEVLVHGYEEWGEDLLRRLDGMFAFALYDAARQTLLLARDRFGEKPLFYAQLGGLFAFASELPALRAHPRLAEQGLDPVALRKFFAYGFLPAPLTLHGGLRKLPQGHLLRLDLKSGALEERAWWRFSIAADDPPPGTPDDWAEELELLVRRAVQSRLESDVPLGIFLSGGIDSSAIISAAAEALLRGELKSFTVGFREKSFDESEPAARMASLVGSRHETEVCELDGVAPMLPELLRRLGEPLGDPSIVPTFLLSRLARRHVTVALGGDGGDELFAGYEPLRVLARARLYKRMVPRPVHEAVAWCAARLPLSDRNLAFSHRLNRALRGLGHPPRFWGPIWLGALGPGEIGELFGEAIDPEELYSEAIAVWDRGTSGTLLDRALEFYTNLYFADDILVKTDRASMLNSLELRAPFLDNHLVEFVRRLPATVKLRRGTTKWILKRAMARRLPAELIGRRKQGFGIPLAKWLRDLPLAETGGAVPGLDETHLRGLLVEHLARRRDHRAALWCWLSLRCLQGEADDGTGSAPLIAAAGP